MTHNKLKHYKELWRYAVVMASFFLIANGFILVIQANLGVDPWNVLHLGIHLRTPLSLGRVVQLTGLAIIIASAFLKVKPDVGTLLNMIFIGFFMDVVHGVGYLPVFNALWARMVSLVTGVAIVGVGTALYISAGLGAGPRDSLMMAIHRQTSVRIGLVRTAIEVAVTAAGFLLGGPVGVGTVLYALTVGIFVEAGFWLIAAFKKRAKAALGMVPEASEQNL